MWRSDPPWLQRVSSVVATLFGLATVVAGGRVLLGSDPGYVVFQPLLVYNTAMGIVYVGAGAIIWSNVASGRWLAGTIAFLNLAVLVLLVVAHQTGGRIAVQSVRAMTLRTVVWIVLFLVTSRIHRIEQNRVDEHAQVAR